jgi:hypothetical protein
MKCGPPKKKGKENRVLFLCPITGIRGCRLDRFGHLIVRCANACRFLNCQITPFLRWIDRSRQSQRALKHSCTYHNNQEYSHIPVAHEILLMTKNKGPSPTHGWEIGPYYLLQHVLKGPGSS